MIEVILKEGSLKNETTVVVPKNDGSETSKKVESKGAHAEFAILKRLSTTRSRNLKLTEHVRILDEGTEAQDDDQDSSQDQSYFVEVAEAEFMDKFLAQSLKGQNLSKSKCMDKASLEQFHEAGRAARLEQAEKGSDSCARRSGMSKEPVFIKVEKVEPSDMMNRTWTAMMGTATMRSFDEESTFGDDPATDTTATSKSSVQSRPPWRSFRSLLGIKKKLDPPGNSQTYNPDSDDASSVNVTGRSHKRAKYESFKIDTGNSTVKQSVESVNDTAADVGSNNGAKCGTGNRLNIEHCPTFETHATEISDEDVTVDSDANTGGFHNSNQAGKGLFTEPLDLIICCMPAKLPM